MFLFSKSEYLHQKFVEFQWDSDHQDLCAFCIFHGFQMIQILIFFVLIYTEIDKSFWFNFFHLFCERMWLMHVEGLRIKVDEKETEKNRKKSWFVF